MLGSQLIRRVRIRLAVAAIGIVALRRGRRVDDRIVVVGDPLIGNVAAFKNYLRTHHPKIEVAQLSLARNSRPSSGKLDARRLRDLLTVARSRAIVTPSGPQGLAPWVAREHRPLFIDVWHGVGFKSRIGSARPAFLDYDAHFVSSEHVAQYYRAHGARAITTGYARMDALHDAAVAADPLILFAPTWGAHTRLDIRSALEVLNEFALSRDLTVAYRPHGYSRALNTDDLQRVFVHGRGAELEGRGADLEVLPILQRARVLVTDWSSIATDYLPLDRPVVYLDGATPEHPGPLGLSDRPGAIVGTREELRSALDQAMEFPGAFASARAETSKRAWGSTLDGRAAERYLQAIVALEDSRAGR